MKQNRFPARSISSGALITEYRVAAPRCSRIRTTREALVFFELYVRSQHVVTRKYDERVERVSESEGITHRGVKKKIRDYR